MANPSVVTTTTTTKVTPSSSSAATSKAAAAAAAQGEDADESTTTSAALPNNNNKYHILAVYLFVETKLSEQDELPQLKKEIETFCRHHNVRGSLLLAPEGINGTISYPPPPSSASASASATATTRDEQQQQDDDDDAVVSFLKGLFGPNLRTRLSYSNKGHVFYRLKIKLKKEILTLRTTTTTTTTDPPQTDDDDNNDDDNEICTDPTKQRGIYVKPGPDWNALLEDPDCWVIDARNDYEVRLGTFKNAQNPQTTNFSQLLPYMKDGLSQQRPKKIAMFCTGGIRCEKASAACMDYIANATSTSADQQQQPNTNTNNIPVYHLEGGILAYLDTVSPSQSLWEGSCYVFDQRVAVTHGLKEVDGITMCYACRGPLLPHQQDGHPDFIQGQQCTFCKDVVTNNPKQQERFQARQKQITLANKKGIRHIHDPKEEEEKEEQDNKTQFQQEQEQQSVPKKQKSSS